MFALPLLLLLLLLLLRWVVAACIGWLLLFPIPPLAQALVLRGGWETAQRKSLLRNDCHGVFTDVTAEAGLAEPTTTQTAVWVDINNDGYLDLYVGNENEPNQLFLNNGNGTFKDISRSSGADLAVFTKAVVAADYDNDGYADLFVSNYRGASALLHNNHNGTGPPSLRK